LEIKVRAREIIINVPICNKLDSDSGVSVGQQSTPEPEGEEDELGAMVFPQDQELELRKAELGKDSRVAKLLLKQDDE
jgi:hypothetical protein